MREMFSTSQLPNNENEIKLIFMKTENVKTQQYQFFNYFKTKKDVEQYSKNGMEVVYVVLPSDVEEFLKEHNFEVKYQIGGGGEPYIYEVYVSEKHQLIVIPNNMYGNNEERYEVYTFKQYEEDDMSIENHWKSSYITEFGEFKQPPFVYHLFCIIYGELVGTYEEVWYDCVDNNLFVSITKNVFENSSEEEKLKIGKTIEVGKNTLICEVGSPNVKFN
jgi:hypothetical protein